MKKKVSGSRGVKLAVLGVVLAGLAATTYFFFGPKGKIHQRHAKAWVIKMKGDVVEKLEKAQGVTQTTYHSIIDSVAKEYTKNSKAAKSEINSLAKDLKKHWHTIVKLAATAKRSTKKAVSKVVRKTRRSK